MDIDPYKCLLSSASREHLKRQAELNDRFVGNVFLPAIHRPSQGPTAAATSPLRHLKVIEQCISAENKREEQLAKCQNDMEKRSWARKFHTQRNHERKLIQALMLGTTVDTHLDITDVSSENSAIALSRSPLHVSVQRATTGITAKVLSEDRVFYKAKITGGVPKTKPHLRKKFNLPECQGSPNKVKPYQPRASKFVETSPAHRTPLLDGQPSGIKKIGAGSPPSHRLSRSATPSRTSPSKPKAAEPPSPVNHSLPRPAQLSLKQSYAGATGANNSPKKQHIKPTTRAVPGIRPSKVKFDTDDELLLMEDDDMLSFEGPTSFLEAQQIAMAVLEVKSCMESEKDAVHHLEASLPVKDDKYESSTTSMRTNSNRPHSSPCSRAELQDASDKKVLISHSQSTTDMATIAFLKIVDSGEDSRRVQTAPAPLAERAPIDGDNTADEEEDKWESYDEAAEDVNSTPLKTKCDDGDKEEKAALPDDELHDDSEQTDRMVPAASVEDDLHVEELAFDEPEAPSQQQSTIEERADIPPDDDHRVVLTEADLDDQAEMEVAEVLFDLVDQLAGDEMDGADAVTASMPTTSSLSASVHIQSAFRGHQARRAFRMALYQEALSCGVLGAMPGSFQGKSGWYQDPKTLMAYYFTIAGDTGEWKQKLVVRCSRLILTHYQMHEELLSKVFISP